MEYIDGPVNSAFYGGCSVGNDAFEDKTVFKQTEIDVFEPSSQETSPTLLWLRQLHPFATFGNLLSPLSTNWDQTAKSDFIYISGVHTAFEN